MDRRRFRAAVFARVDKEKTTAEVLDNFHQTHAAVVATLRQMPFDKLLQPRYADDPEQRPLLNWVAGDTHEHYQEHSAALPNT
jgi:hypothetical protein